MIGISIAFLMMLRVRALYAGCFSIQAVVFAIFITFVGINAYVLTHGVPVYHPAYPLVDARTGIIDPKIGRTFSSSTGWLPLIFVSTVMFFTIYRTARSPYSRTTSDMFRELSSNMTEAIDALNTTDTVDATDASNAMDTTDLLNPATMEGNRCIKLRWMRRTQQTRQTRQMQ